MPWRQGAPATQEAGRHHCQDLPAPHRAVRRAQRAPRDPAPAGAPAAARAPVCAPAGPSVVGPPIPGVPIPGAPIPGRAHTRTAHTHAGRSHPPVVLLRDPQRAAHAPLHNERIRGTRRKVRNLFGGDRAFGAGRFGRGRRRLPHFLRCPQRFLRQELQREIRGGRIGSHPDLPGHLLKPEHLHLDRPSAIRQLGERESPLLIGGGDDLLVTLACGHGGAGQSQTAGFHRAVVFRSHQTRDGDARGHQAPPRELPMRFLAITHKEAIAPVIVSFCGQSFTSLTHSLPCERSII